MAKPLDFDLGTYWKEDNIIISPTCLCEMVVKKNEHGPHLKEKIEHQLLVSAQV